MSNRKLMVEICNAKNLMPKDGQGTASAYVIVDFDGQRRRTKTISRDLNPQWDEKIEFLVHDVASMATEILELNVYNDNKKTGKRSTFLGKVKITGSTFPQSGSEALVYYPLEKRSVFSQIKGEIGIKICYVDEEPPADPAAEEKKPEAAETPPAETEEKPPEEKKPEEETKAEEKPAEEEKKEEKTTEDQKKEDAPAPAPAAEAAAPATPPPPPPVENAAIAQSPKPKQVDESLQLARKHSNLDPDVVSLSNHHRGSSAFDLVDRMPFLYVRVVKAKREDKETDDSTIYYAKLAIGTHSITTKEQSATKPWDQVFAFDKEGLNSTSLEVSVFDRKKKVTEDNKEEVTEACLGTVSFELTEVPKRVPPDSPLAPQWYTLENSPENSPVTDVMLAVWLGTQADETFQEAWQSDSGGLIPETRAKVYLSPKLWYLRLTVIQTQDLQLGSGPEPRVKNPELFVKGQLGPQLFKTNRTTVGSSSTSSNPTWNEDLVFVAAEPFEPFLVISVEDASNGQTVGHAKVQVASIDKRTDDRSTLGSRWFNLVGDESRPYAGRIHVGVCLEGGYHVLDEAAHVTSDVRPTAKQLSKPAIGVLEVGIRGATNLLPVKTKDGTRGTTDSYVVAKYGPKWVRTRTILDRFNPRWNEQYTWDVYDPCTVLTIGVFDNGRYRIGEDDKPSKDVRLGKLRIRLSTLDTNRVYMGSYSLIVLLPNGAKKMGEIEIAVRFSCSSWISLLQAYSTPMLPRMHYVHPLGPIQQDMLRHNAMKIVTARLGRSEPALGQEVVQFMLDSDTHTWSMRRSKSNWFRIINGLSKAATLARWLDSICTWAHPPTTVLVHVLLLAIVLCPHLILPTICLYAFLIVALRYRYRMQAPVTMDPRLSQVDSVGPDELDEEFDGFPSSRTPDQVRIRYDRLRALAGRAQTLLGDVAAQGERLEALCNWRDPRATGIFVVICLLASLVFYIVPFKAFLLGWGFFYMRHPRFRGDMPSLPVNFFRRLPPLSDQIL
ncbi:putative C2 domain, phosphoribosyltransferase, C2 domain superfamily [Helianthus annuus]|nr:putative C2 domain, phosphoribosyltransferase, C2 domain superfamily [Helianthus annuus]KAJ0432581.1 putative C2 domain, phosphoribosyltransferase, C2 domain superfamily [Helianthus annuus]KAJ0446822.1 putative C2 domain, phosphoribosyltransferase, C2 domain superfamily [Helianthus annuus]KAJ0631716.1 putative C2 domain, phosphoribosyltransferase, C2 domain superfamily [Helianthus annuus]KAJ0635626.1 putative C2 domain, phosphoribosyltransferase, C2 domain superfamily [Helianthus annuus]